MKGTFRRASGSSARSGAGLRAAREGRVAPRLAPGRDDAAVHAGHDPDDGLRHPLLRSAELLSAVGGHLREAARSRSRPLARRRASSTAAPTSAWRACSFTASIRTARITAFEADPGAVRDARRQPEGERRGRGRNAPRGALDVDRHADVPVRRQRLRHDRLAAGRRRRPRDRRCRACGCATCSTRSRSIC